MSEKPKYLEIKEKIKTDILEKKYNIGDKIPSERELAVIYGVTRVTVQKAMHMLEQDGFIEKIHGKGMFVIKTSENNIYVFNNEKSDSVLGVSQELKGKVEITSQLVSFDKIQATPYLAKLLAIKTCDEVYTFRRIRFIDGIPGIIEDSNIPVNIINIIPLEVLKEKSLYEYIEKVTNKKITDADSIIEAALFDDELAELLQIKPGSPMLKISEITRLEDKTIFNYSHSYNRADLFKIKNMKIKK